MARVLPVGELLPLSAPGVSQLADRVLDLPAGHRRASGLLLSTLETVATETPASRATSLMVWFLVIMSRLTPRADRVTSVVLRRYVECRYKFRY